MLGKFDIKGQSSFVFLDEIDLGTRIPIRSNSNLTLYRMKYLFFDNFILFKGIRSI